MHIDILRSLSAFCATRFKLLDMKTNVRLLRIGLREITDD